MIYDEPNPWCQYSCSDSHIERFLFLLLFQLSIILKPFDLCRVCPLIWHVLPLYSFTPASFISGAIAQMVCKQCLCGCLYFQNQVPLVQLKKLSWPSGFQTLFCGLILLFCFKTFFQDKCWASYFWSSWWPHHAHSPYVKRTSEPPSCSPHWPVTPACN